MDRRDQRAAEGRTCSYRWAGSECVPPQAFGHSAGCLLVAAVEHTKQRVRVLLSLTGGTTALSLRHSNMAISTFTTVVSLRQNMHRVTAFIGVHRKQKIFKRWSSLAQCSYRTLLSQRSLSLHFIEWRENYYASRQKTARAQTRRRGLEVKTWTHIESTE